jgi:CRP-like cAMP-binding protein
MRRLQPDREAPWLEDVFGALEFAQLERLLASGTLHDLEPGETIPDPRGSLVRIVDGFVSLGVQAGDRRQTLAIFGTGDAICSPLFHEWDEMVYRIRAEEITELMLLPQAAVLTAMADNPEFSRRILRQLSYASWQLMREIHMLTFFNLPQRVAQVLLNLAAIFGQPDPRKGTRLRLRFTQGELAEMAGARRETLSTVLQDFREEDILDLRYARIDIKDMDALRRLAGAPPLPFLARDGHVS